MSHTGQAGASTSARLDAETHYTTGATTTDCTTAVARALTIGVTTIRDTTIGAATLTYHDVEIGQATVAPGTANHTLVATLTTMAVTAGEDHAVAALSEQQTADASQPTPATERGTVLIQIADSLLSIFGPRGMPISISLLSESAAHRTVRYLVLYEPKITRSGIVTLALV